MNKPKLLLLSVLLPLVGGAFSESSDSLQDLGVTQVRARVIPVSKSSELQQETALQKDALLRRQSNSLAETIRDQPGIAIRSMGPAPARPVVNGLSGEHIIVLEEGSRTGDLSASSPDHAMAVEPLSLQRIMIVKGTRLLNRSSSLSGALVEIDHQRFQKQDNSWSARQVLSAETGQPGTASATEFNLPIHQVFLRGEYTQRSADNTHTPAGILKNTDLFSRGAALSASTQDTNWQLGISARNYHSDYGIPGGFIGAHPKGVDISMEKQNLVGMGEYHQHGDTLQCHLQHTYYRHQEFESNGLVGAEFVKRLNLARIDWSQERLLSFFEVQSGIELSHQDLQMGGYVFTPPTTQTDAWAWGSGAWRPGIRGMEVLAGVRVGFVRFDPHKNIYSEDHSNASRSYLLVASSISLLQRIAPGQFLEGEAHRSTRAPTAEELYNQGPHLAAYSYETGNSSLDEEASYGNSFSWKISKLDWRGSTTIHADYFPSYLAPRATGDTNWSQLLPIYSVSNEKAILYGANATLQKDPESGLGHSIGLSMVRGYFVKDWGNMPMMPPPRMHLECSWTTKQNRFAMNSEIVLSQHNIDRFEESTEGYVILGLSWQSHLRLNHSEHTFSLELENLTNAEYYNHLSRLKSIMPETGRSVQVLWQVAL